ncbi:MAG: hypothetical protein H0S80_09775 [Desulfovibrionaceae bacterium]|nr:hypothetical protein [Desulfovibrionaceae bacterium]
MAKYNDIVKTLAFIREGYSAGKAPFRFTVSDIAKVINSSENTAKEVIRKLNDRALFWRGRFPSDGDNFIVSTAVFERIKGLYK